VTTDADRPRLDPDALRRLFLFEGLSDDQLRWLAARGWVEDVPAGTAIATQGEPAEVLFVLLDGTVSLSTQVGTEDVEIVRTDQVGAYGGATRSYVDEDAAETYSASARALTDARLWLLPATDFGTAIREWFPMAVHLLEGLFLGMSRSHQAAGQRQQLLALGSITAGLTHELNNPAAAAVRATSALRDRVAGMRHKLALLAHGDLDPRLLELLVDVQEEAVTAVATVPTLTAVEESEREDALVDWLDDHGVPDSYALAPIFVGAGTTPEFLDKVAAGAPGELLEGALRWLAYTLEAELLLGEITDSVTRISSLVSAAKQYSHMDRAPYETVDVHDGLESTLVMMAARLEGHTVVREYDRSLPPVPAYAGELTQVWTNLLDNAAHAMDDQRDAGGGTLTVRTSRDGNCAQVEVADTGPGVPEELQQRVFEPFFTTKPVGQGTGLGLDIAHRIVVGRHEGSLRVDSRPGDTRFVVRLPLTADEHPAPGPDTAGTAPPVARESTEE
jgi:signal transduction histidine kinase